KNAFMSPAARSSRAARLRGRGSFPGKGFCIGAHPCCARGPWPPGAPLLQEVTPAAADRPFRRLENRALPVAEAFWNPVFQNAKPGGVAVPPLLGSGAHRLDELRHPGIAPLYIRPVHRLELSLGEGM